MNDIAKYAPPPDTRPMRDKFRWLVTDAAEAVVIHEALMSYRNREAIMPADTLRAEAADRILASLRLAIDDLAEIRRTEMNVPASSDA